MSPSNSTHRATLVRHPIGGLRTAADRVSRRPGAEDDRVRVSDAERETAAAELRAHAAAGRLDIDELEARVGAVLASRTRGEVAVALAGLPVARAAGTIATTPRPAQPLRTFAWVMVLLLAVWLATGAGHFWPIYPALGWGLPLLLGRGCARRSQAPAGP